MNTCLRYSTLTHGSRLPAAALTVFLACVTGSVLADAPGATEQAETVSAAVSLADLDLSTPDDAQAARVRLAKMAQHLCRKLGDTRRASDSATYADCYRETLANAVRQLKVPTTEDEKALRNLPQAFTNAWAKHDGHELARIMADDVDFVTGSATWLSGRADLEKYHTRLLSGLFNESTRMPLETAVRFIRPDLALLHCSWRHQGDESVDGSVRPSRSGMMTMLAEKRNGTWLVVAAQNTNSAPVSPELLQGIESPITETSSR